MIQYKNIGIRGLENASLHYFTHFLWVFVRNVLFRIDTIFDSEPFQMLTPETAGSAQKIAAIPVGPGRDPRLRIAVQRRHCIRSYGVL